MSFPNDYEALTAGHGYVALKDWSTVTMTGEDRQSFLHNMCTNDIRRLSAGKSCEAFCTDVQGKIVAHVFVTAREDRLELLMVPGQAETLIAHLDRYIIREDVVLADATSDLTWLFVGSGETASELAEFGVVQSRFAGLEGSLLGAAAGQLQKVQDRLHDACCQEVWETLRIESGLPLFGVEFDSTNLPQEVNRDELAISFNKGCYLGQETIARIDALGHVNQKVVLLRFEGEAAPPVGLELCVANKSVGRVTSSCWSPKFKASLALAKVRRNANELGSKLESDFGNATVISPVAKEN
ncbi:MAG: folate-binding protein YgfZ [Planctomycetes bacterium]|nr:folate-binding protein YgfZ [Planctomycetota bacterium]